MTSSPLARSSPLNTGMAEVFASFDLMTFSTPLSISTTAKPYTSSTLRKKL
ncbi:Uncharacterised protein [Vibrio cholerae]|nr:Uncharacterised protein [Vibrio cholerae]